MRVKLLSKTENMFEVISWVWQCSRSQGPVKMHVRSDEVDQMMELFFNILEEGIPIAEMIDFIFLLEDIPISLREQLVRHRIGAKVDDRVGIDHVPDLADSSFWSQSMRVLDMSNFEYFTPDTVKENLYTISIYQKAIESARHAYKTLVENGVPKEDARNVIPLGATHRIVWKLNLAALKHVLGKRGCWILQLGIWKPVIEGMVNELAKIHERFRVLISPPCLKKGKFTDCMFGENNKARMKGDVDRLPPCPLFLHYYQNYAAWYSKTENCLWQHDKKHGWHCSDKEVEDLMKQMRKSYEKFWSRNVDTGELLGD